MASTEMDKIPYKAKATADGRLSFFDGGRSMRRLLALGALLLMLGSVARADSFTATQWAGPGGENSTAFAGANGMQLNNVYAGSVYVTDSADPNRAFIAFTEMSSSAVYSIGQANFNGTLSTGGVGNQLAYLITRVMAPAEAGAGPTNAEAAAIQLAIWQLTSNFNPSSATSDQTVLGFVKDIDTLLAGNPVTNPSSPFSQFQPYLSSATYDSSSVYLITPSSGDYQALIGVDPAAAAPEPSTLLFASLGALAFAGYGWKRRKRS
jgi:hypothetical protein